ncbi:MAG: diadenylate cyclase CdaA [Lachnospirales bacterium]
MSFLRDFFSDLNLYFFSIPQVSISNLVDIFFVTVLIYYLLIWVKSTRVWTIFKGVLVLLAFYFFAYVFQLYTITWIINNTLSVGVIALIILFQPEIRSALEHVGSSSKFTILMDKKPEIVSKTIDEIVIAAKQMGKSRTGALIIIEQNVNLRDYIATGIEIDGKVSSQLILNIFEDKTPLHDGAIILRKDRISAASCILPLTKNQIDKALGTRHRAGVGMSETTDAYVIIVSEETGKLSFAHKGELIIDVSEEDLKNKLKFNESFENEKSKIKLQKKKVGFKKK